MARERRSLRCYGCSGMGHIRAECPSTGGGASCAPGRNRPTRPEVFSRGVVAVEAGSHGRSSTTRGRSGRPLLRGLYTTKTGEDEEKLREGRGKRGLVRLGAAPVVLGRGTGASENFVDTKFAAAKPKPTLWLDGSHDGWLQVRSPPPTAGAGDDAPVDHQLSFSHHQRIVHSLQHAKPL